MSISIGKSIFRQCSHEQINESLILLQGVSVIESHIVFLQFSSYPAFSPLKICEQFFKNVYNVPSESVSKGGYNEIFIN